MTIIHDLAHEAARLYVDMMPLEAFRRAGQPAMAGHSPFVNDRALTPPRARGRAGWST